MDTTDAFLKVVHAMEHCERESGRSASRRHHYHYLQGYLALKNILQTQWGVRLELSRWRRIGLEEMAETMRDPDYYKKFLLGDWMSLPTLSGTGPHLYIASDGERGWCAGPGRCTACIEKRGCTIDEVLGWRDDTGRKGFEAFGKGGAHCSQTTYYELCRRCDRAKHQTHELWFLNPFNSFRVHPLEGVPDGLLVPCECVFKCMECGCATDRHGPSCSRRSVPRPLVPLCQADCTHRAHLPGSCGHKYRDGTNCGCGGRR